MAANADAALAHSSEAFMAPSGMAAAIAIPAPIENASQLSSKITRSVCDT